LMHLSDTQLHQRRHQQACLAPRCVHVPGKGDSCVTAVPVVQTLTLGIATHSITSYKCYATSATFAQAGSPR
jgi:hypothetical protein